jgi:hypothetical protein
MTIISELFFFSLNDENLKVQHLHCANIYIGASWYEFCVNPFDFL